MGTKGGTSSAELAIAEGALRAAAAVALVASLALPLGTNGLGLLQGRSLLHATQEAEMVMNERTELTGAAGLASVAAANARLGSLEQRSDQEASGSTTNWAEVSGPTEVSVSFWNPTLAQRWAYVLVRALPAAAAAAGLWLLAALVRSCRVGDPFTGRNVRRLGWITVLTAAGGVIGDWGASFVRRWLLDSSDAARLVPMDFSLSFGFVGLVLVLGVVTGVWRRGVAMREDLDGLV
jgi:hypothetical protein